jgi:hypothetical protein
VVNRAALLQTIEPLIEPSPTQREALRKSLDKALVEASVALPLEAARRLSSSAKDEFEIVIRDLYVAKDMQRLAAKWEPSRTLDADFKESLREDLLDLLRDRRPQYRGPATLTLNEAQDPANTQIHRQIDAHQRREKLLKAWDGT